MIYIQHATVLTPHRQIDDGAVLIDGPQILAVGTADEISRPAGADEIDASGLILVPGFIDLQINGAFGHDFTADPASIWAVAAQLPRYGVTSFLPTIVTSPLETVAAAQEAVSRGSNYGPGGATPLGVHIEGPFLNPEKKGAHNPAYLRLPDPELVREWSSARGVRLVTLAPELPGALDLVAVLAKQGVVVSAGHSTATCREAEAGFDAGIRYGTHLFNAMPPLHHREPGLAGALLTDGRPVSGLITDGIHTHPSMIRLAWRALDGGSITLVTDAMAALGMAPGRHLLGDLDVVVDGQSARLLDGTLAGSIVSLDAALRNLIAYTGCSLAQALPAVTTTPAKVLGLGATLGRIAPRYLANLVLLTPDLQVQAAIAKGQIVYEQSPG
jgi:N-acetylglucosamine-6-phosphate deacetylase